jgi:hypothetical protein
MVDQNRRQSLPTNLNDTISATTSAAVAMTITQTGAFDAFLVQDAAADASPFVIDQAGNVGIGTTAPGEKLEVVGVASATIFKDYNTPAYFLDPADPTLSLMIAGSINSNGAFSITSKDTSGTDTNGNITIDAGTGNVEIGVAGAGKLDAGTIDPPYTINGSKFATYMSGMTGVKEETTGNVFAGEYISGTGYRATLDLADSAEGSDIWVFSKTANLKNNLDKLVVLLSSSGNSKTWYDIDPVAGKLYLYATSPTTISYRLTAPRFDSYEWLNTRDSGSAGFVINDDSPWSVSDAITQVINDGKSQINRVFGNLETNLISPTCRKRAHHHFSRSIYDLRSTIYRQRPSTDSRWRTSNCNHLCTRSYFAKTFRQ